MEGGLMLSRVSKGWDWILNGVLFLLLAVMVAVIGAQVWYRFVFNNPLDWSEELGRYLFIWISFIGAAVGIRQRVHLGIDIIQKLTSPRVYRVVSVVVNLLIQIFLLTIAYSGFKILNVIKFQSSASLHIPMLYPYMAVPVGCILMLINSLRLTWETLTGRGTGESPK